MKLKNNGPKIINIGSIVLLPGDEASFPKSLIDTPAIRILEKNKFIELQEEPVQAKEPEVKPAPPIEVEEEEEDEVVPSVEKPAEKPVEPAVEDSPKAEETVKEDDKKENADTAVNTVKPTRTRKK